MLHVSVVLRYDNIKSSQDDQTGTLFNFQSSHKFYELSSKSLGLIPPEGGQGGPGSNSFLDSLISGRRHRGLIP